MKQIKTKQTKQKYKAKHAIMLHNKTKCKESKKQSETKHQS